MFLGQYVSMEIITRIYGAPSTFHNRFLEWQKAGLFEKLWQTDLLEYDNKVDLMIDYQRNSQLLSQILEVFFTFL